MHVKNKQGRKILSFLLVLSMIFSVLSMSTVAFAEDETTVETVDTSDDTISTETQEDYEDNVETVEPSDINELFSYEEDETIEENEINSNNDSYQADLSNYPISPISGTQTFPKDHDPVVVQSSGYPNSPSKNTTKDDTLEEITFEKAVGLRITFSDDTSIYWSYGRIVMEDGNGNIVLDSKQLPNDGEGQIAGRTFCVDGDTVKIWMESGPYVYSFHHGFSASVEPLKDQRTYKFDETEVTGTVNGIQKLESAPEAPVKYQADFVGWFDQYGQEFTGEIYDDLVFTPKYYHYYFASFSDGTTILGGPIKYYEDEVPSYDDAPDTVKNYGQSNAKAIYSGWYDEDGKEFAGQLLTKNTTYYPRWISMDNAKGFRKVTSVDDFQIGYHYILAMQSSLNGPKNDGNSDYFFSLGSNVSNKFINEIPFNYTESLNSGEYFVPLDADCVLTLKDRWYETPSGLHVRMKANNTKGLKIRYSDDPYQPFFTNTDGDVQIRNVDSVSSYGGGSYLSNDGVYLNYSEGSGDSLGNFETSYYSKNGGYYCNIQILTDAPQRKDISSNRYYRLTDISKLKDVESFLIVIPNGNIPFSDREHNFPSATASDPAIARALYYHGSVNNNNWLSQNYLKNEDGSISVPYYTRNYWYMDFSHGAIAKDDSGKEKYKEGRYCTFEYVVNNGSGMYLAPGTLYANEYIFFPYETKAKEVRFEYSGEAQEIYMRGNGSKTWLGFDENQNRYIQVNSIDDPRIVPIEIYALGKEAPVKVTYHEVDGTANEPIYIQNELGIEQRSDIYLDNLGNQVSKDTPDVTHYSFLGWSTDAKFKGNPYLSLNESANLYDFNTKLDAGDYKPEIKRKFSLIGTGNPDRVDEISIKDEVAPGVTEVNLYPIYAYYGFDTVVTANHKNGKDNPAVVGISDWKALQGDTGYENHDREKWLGSANIEVYLDGQLWTKENMYFSYHNDNAVDLNIKFIWDNIVKEYNGEKDPLYAYMSDPAIWPKHDQVGHYVIDGIWAEQGDSEDGLKYAYNWASEYGGQLDNVKGGSTVKIYVTNIYNVLYYLDDEPLHVDSIGNGNETWTDRNYYATPGTENAFGTVEKKSTYQVSNDSNNRYRLLMGHDVTKDETGNSFDVKNKVRGEYDTFAYRINTHENIIALAKSPESMVPKGRYLVSTDWILKDEVKEVSNHAWESKYQLSGGQYGSHKSTVPAYKENMSPDSPELDELSPTPTSILDLIATSNNGEKYYQADVPYTFHLYAYTDVITNPEPTPPEETEEPNDNLANLILYKTDEELEFLPGASFKLVMLVDGDEIEIKEYAKGPRFEFVGLKDGQYRIYETVTPSGYKGIGQFDLEIIDGQLHYEDVPYDSLTVTNSKDSNIEPEVLGNQITEEDYLRWLQRNKDSDAVDTGDHVYITGYITLIIISLTIIILLKRQKDESINNR